VQTRRLAASFKHLNSPLPFSAPELCSTQSQVGSGCFGGKIPESYGTSKCYKHVPILGTMVPKVFCVTTFHFVLWLC